MLLHGDFPQRLWRGVRVILSDLSGVGSNPTVSNILIKSVKLFTGRKEAQYERR